MTELFRGVADRPESRALTRGLWARRAVMTLFALIVVAALVGVFGQRSSATSSSSPRASLRLEAPEVVRGGLFFQARIDVRAGGEAIEHPRLVLGQGWADGLQVNSIEPAAQSESSRDGRLVLSYDSLGAGERLTVFAQFQVNPTQPRRRDFSVELDDAEAPLARVHRTLTTLP
jgi:hypothetical protein